MAKHKAKQVEVKWDKPEPFALVVQQTNDGDRVAADAARLAKDKQQSEQRQEQLVYRSNPKGSQGKTRPSISEGLT